MWFSSFSRTDCCGTRKDGDDTFVSTFKFKSAAVADASRDARALVSKPDVLQPPDLAARPEESDRTTKRIPKK